MAGRAEMGSDLRTRSISALLWSGAESGIGQVVQFAVSLILARLLSPEEFGIVALLLMFNAVALSIVDGGFSSALIQRKSITRIDESTVFWFTLFVGCVAAYTLVCCADEIAIFFAQPDLEGLSVHNSQRQTGAGSLY